MKTPKMNYKVSSWKGKGAVPKTKLTPREDKAYVHAMGFYNGNEKKVVKDLEKEFPRLKKYKKWI